MASDKPVALFAFSHPWMKEMVLKAAPPDFEVRFLERRDEQTLQRELPVADLFVTTRLPADLAPMLVGWTAKMLALKRRGVRSYRKILPLFLGLILGDFLTGGIWSVVAPSSNVSGYLIFP